MAGIFTGTGGWQDRLGAGSLSWHLYDSAVTRSAQTQFTASKLSPHAGRESTGGRSLGSGNHDVQIGPVLRRRSAAPASPANIKDVVARLLVNGLQCVVLIRRAHQGIFWGVIKEAVSFRFIGQSAIGQAAIE